MRPARMCTIAAVSAETPEMPIFAPAPAAGEVAAKTIAGRRMLPRTRPTAPPATATRKHHAATRTSVTSPGRYAVSEGSVTDPAARAFTQESRSRDRERRMLRKVMWSGLYAGLGAAATMAARRAASGIWRVATGED